jgi:hypothetical protein
MDGRGHFVDQNIDIKTGPYKYIKKKKENIG